MNGISSSEMPILCLFGGRFWCEKVESYSNNTTLRPKVINQVCTMKSWGLRTTCTTSMDPSHLKSSTVLGLKVFLAVLTIDLGTVSCEWKFWDKPWVGMWRDYPDWQTDAFAKMTGSQDQEGLLGPFLSQKLPVGGLAPGVKQFNRCCHDTSHH